MHYDVRSHQIRIEVHRFECMVHMMCCHLCIQIDANIHDNARNKSKTGADSNRGNVCKLYVCDSVKARTVFTGAGQIHKIRSIRFL